MKETWNRFVKEIELLFMYINKVAGEPQEILFHDLNCQNQKRIRRM